MKIHFTADWQGPRRLVLIDGHQVFLMPRHYKYLLALAVGRISNSCSDGWVDKTDIEPGENQIKYIWGLRRELSGHFHESVRGLGAQIENLRRSNGACSRPSTGNCYRLNFQSGEITLDTERLLNEEDYDLWRWINKLMTRSGPSKSPRVHIRILSPSARSSSAQTVA